MKLIVAAVTAWLLWFLSGIFLKKFWEKGLKVSLSFTENGVVEGQQAALKEIITNNKFLPLPILHVKFQMGRELVFTDSNNFKITDHNYRSDIFSCMPWQEIRRTLTFTCTKRGYYSIHQADLISYDLFLFSRFVTHRPVDTAMYVYPAPIAPLGLDLPLRELLGQVLLRRALLRDPFEMQSIRPYQSFDTYRDINWKATARTGNLKVNVYAPTSSWQVTFLLDISSDLVRKDHGLTEEAIRLCGSMASQLLERGIPVSIRTNGIDCLSHKPGFLKNGAGPEHLRSVMELLARILTDGACENPDWFLLGGMALWETPAFSGPDSADPLSAGLPGASVPDPADSSSPDTTLYVLISPKQWESLASSYDSLCLNSPGSQWILPMRPGDALRISEHLHCAKLIPWEVPYDYS